MNTRCWSGCLTAALVPAVAAPALVRADDQAARPYLGVVVEPMEKDAGAKVRHVAPKSPAEQAGLKVGDVIVKVNDKDVKDAAMLVECVSAHSIGTKLDMKVMRDGKEHMAAATLAAQPRPMQPRVAVERGAFLGVWSQPLTDAMKKDLGLEHGCMIMDVEKDSPAAKAGLAKDDVIVSFNDQKMATPEELRSAVHKLGAGKEATVKFLRNKEAKEAKIKLAETPLGFGRFQLPENADPEMKKKFEELHKRFQTPANADPELKKMFEQLRKRFEEFEKK